MSDLPLTGTPSGEPAADPLAISGAGATDRTTGPFDSTQIGSASGQPVNIRPDPAEQPSTVAFDPTISAQLTSEVSGAAPEAVDPSVEANKVGFDVRFLDFAGRPISGLQHKVFITEEGKRLEFPGTSDATGNGIRMSGLAVLTPLELWIRKDDGSYVLKHKGTVGCADLSLCAVSPHIKIKVVTELHAGTPGTLLAKPTAGDRSVENRPNAPTTLAMGGKLPDPSLSSQRDANGNPVSTATKLSKDANGKSRLPTLGLFSWGYSSDAGATATRPLKMPPSPSGVRIDPVRVNDLLKTMEQQVSWDWIKLKAIYGTSGGMKIAMTAKTFDYLPDSKEPEKFKGQCYSSVKVGLWRAGLVEGVEGGVYPSTMARPWLVSQGFFEVSEELPDARWAAPGDVITYRYDDATIEANKAKISSALKQYDSDLKDYPARKRDYDEAHKAWLQRRAASLLSTASGNPGKKAAKNKDPEPKPPKAPEQPLGENYGHIDIRGYDGYFSDARATKLPSAAARGPIKGFVVNGIFRKAYDDQPSLRARAFLKCLREWECHEESDDSKRYFLMRTPVNGSRRFTETSKHPQEGNEKNTAAGAYQFTLDTYHRLSSAAFGIGSGFSPALQDRFAVAYLEVLPSSPLGLIRSGNIVNAVQLLTAIWSSLPGGKQTRTELRNKVSHVFTMDDFMQRYELFLQELKEA